MLHVVAALLFSGWGSNAEGSCLPAAVHGGAKSPCVRAGGLRHTVNMRSRLPRHAACPLLLDRARLCPLLCNWRVYLLRLTRHGKWTLRTPAYLVNCCPRVIHDSINVMRLENLNRFLHLLGRRHLSLHDDGYIHNLSMNRTGGISILNRANHLHDFLRHMWHRHVHDLLHDSFRHTFLRDLLYRFNWVRLMRGADDGSDLRLVRRLRAELILSLLTSSKACRFARQLNHESA